MGSIREGRNGEKVAKWFMETFKDYPDAQLELIDLRDYDLPMFADAITPSARSNNKHPNPKVQKWLDKVNSAQGYIFITPEYNHSISSALKNAIDYAFVEWHHKPVGFISYGGVAGGARAVEHLRGIAAQIKLYSVREQVLIPFVWNAFDENGVLQDSERYTKKAKDVLDEVVKLANKLHN